jgi:hypothetical protein
VVSLSSQTFTITSSDEANVGTYTVTLIGCLASGVCSSIFFRITIQSACLSYTITPSLIAPQIYYVGQTALVASFGAFTLSVTTTPCPLTYSMINTATLATPNPAIFSLSGTSISI